MNGRLLLEIVVVGGGLVILYAIVQEGVRTAGSGLSSQTQVYVSVFLAGGLFHLLCELTGVNAWYLDHGVAALTRKASR